MFASTDKLTAGNDNCSREDLVAKVGVAEDRDGIKVVNPERQQADRDVPSPCPEADDGLPRNPPERKGGVGNLNLSNSCWPELNMPWRSFSHPTMCVHPTSCSLYA